MSKKSIFVIGECMIELQRQSESDSAGLAYRFGGDTLNAAVYLTRSIDTEAFEVAYVSALGTDKLSDEMCASWEQEGIVTRHVQRLPDKLPGMYLIETDAKGERRFLYWRNDSAARYWLQGQQAQKVCKSMMDAHAIYLSGISLAILPPADRERLFGALAVCRAKGVQIIFDNNYRPRLWMAREDAVSTYRRMLQLTDLALLTLDDEEALYGETDVDTVITRTQGLGVREIVIKRGAASCIVQCNEGRFEVEAEAVTNVVDTTAAGDSFGAAYLAARLAGHSASDAARAGHRLASTVIRHRGAIIPREAMPG